MTALAGRRIELWVEARAGVPAVNPIMAALLDDLAAAGATVAVRVPEREVIDPGRRAAGGPADLVLLKTPGTLALALALADEAGGVRFLNGARATGRAHDKAATVARLAAAGLPVPTTYLWAVDAEPAGPPPGTRGAWVSKPTRGVHGRGVAVHPRFPAVLDESPVADAAGSPVVDDGTRLVQEWIGDDAADVKVYVADGRCFAGSKPFSATSYAADEIAPVTLDPATAELVRAVGAALELRCYGLDLRSRGDRPVIVDANPFPGYRGFPAAVPALRAEIERALGVAGR